MIGTVDQQGRAAGHFLLGQCLGGRGAHGRNLVLECTHQRLHDLDAVVLVERLGGRLPHGGILIAQPSHEQRRGARLHHIGELEHRHAAYPGIVVRAARSDVGKIGIESFEHRHARPHRSR